MSSVQLTLPTGEIQCLGDPTPEHQLGEIWKVPLPNLRRGHSDEVWGFGMLIPAQDRDFITLEQWRFEKTFYCTSSTH